jgi:hypothetical protein
LNIAMDTLAKRRLKWLHATHARTSFRALRNEGWRCTVDGAKITSDPGPAVRHHVFGRELSQKLEEKGRLSADAYATIDWPAISVMMQRAPKLYRLWVTKHISGFFAHGTNMRRWKFWTHDCCPCCQSPKEDKLHILTCPAPAGLHTWRTAVESFRMWLEAVDTATPIVTCFVSALLSRDPLHVFATTGSPSLQLASARQADIGWVNFTEGKIAQDWRTLQKIHYQSLSSRRTAQSWATGVVHQLLLITHTQWTYRNSVLHERDSLGRAVNDMQEVNTAVTAHFDLGLDGLHPDDYHFLNRGRESVSALSLPDVRAWLSGIQLARRSYDESEARTITSMQQVMASWLHSAA